MKKPSNPKKSAVKKSTDKGKESGELRKPAKLKPLKEKEKKNWKNNLEEEEEEAFPIEDDLALDSSFDDEDEEEFFDENY